MPFEITRMIHAFIFQKIQASTICDNKSHINIDEIFSLVIIIYNKRSNIVIFFGILDKFSNH